MSDINLSELDLQRLQEGFVLVMKYASDQYGPDSSVTIRYDDAKNPKCGRYSFFGQGNKNPCLLPINHKEEECSDESPETLILGKEN